LRHALDRGQLCLDLVLQLFASAQRITGYAGAFYMAPSLLSGLLSLHQLEVSEA
jgi:hypothetical protein